MIGGVRVRVCACADDDTGGRRRRGVAGDKPRTVVRGDGGGLRHARLPLHHRRLRRPRLQGILKC